MKRYLVALVVLLFATAAQAQPKGWGSCADLGVLINAQTMESTRSFAHDTSSDSLGYGLLVLAISLTDANTSITRFDVTCTVSVDGNVTDLVPQVETVAAGVATQVDAGVWQKANPGTKAWPIRVRLNGYPDFACSFAVGAGTGASADLLTVRGRVCAD